MKRFLYIYLSSQMHLGRKVLALSSHVSFNPSKSLIIPGKLQIKATIKKCNEGKNSFKNLISKYLYHKKVLNIVSQNL